MPRGGHSPFIARAHKIHLAQLAEKKPPKPPPPILDPVLLAVGIEAPYVDPRKNRFRAVLWAGHIASDAKRKQMQADGTWRGSKWQLKGGYKSGNTVENIAVRREVADILNRYRRLGEVRG